MNKDRAKGMLWGLVVGDALGSPIQSSSKDGHPHTTDNSGWAVSSLYGLDAIPNRWVKSIKNHEKVDASIESFIGALDVGFVRELAYKHHKGQFRKGGDIPYVEHPASVVRMLRNWGVGVEPACEDDIVTLAVAWGHDLMEDTDLVDAEILEGCAHGQSILDGIRMLTFLRKGESVDWSKEEHDAKKRAYITHVGYHSSPRYLIVKIADRLCNTLDFLALGRSEKARSYFAAGEDLYANIKRLPERFRPNVSDAVAKVREQLGV